MTQRGLEYGSSAFLNVEESSRRVGVKVMGFEKDVAHTAGFEDGRGHGLRNVGASWGCKGKKTDSAPEPPERNAAPSML